MSVQALQRVAVRMLYDAEFLDRVYGDVDEATGDCDLTARERQWLRTPDRRAWSVDPLRRTRSLTALVEEFATSIAVFARAHPDASSLLDRFFSSTRFHVGMQAGESLAALFAGWFAGRIDASGSDLLTLEATLARLRREREAGCCGSVTPAPLGAGSTLGFSPGVAVLECGRGTLSRFTGILAVLRAGDLWQRSIEHDLALPVATTEPGTEGIIVDGRHSDPRLEPVSPDLARVLRWLDPAIPFEDFVDRARSEGATREDCRSIVEDLSGDGLVRVI
jgi:hypothetical protein